MLLSSTLTAFWSKQNKNYYISKGYTFTKYDDAFSLNFQDASPGSKKIMVECYCDYCLDVDIKTLIIKPIYLYYRDNINNIVHKDCCNNVECMKKKRKDVFVLKYGVENSNQLESSKIKTKETNLIKYGVEHHTKTDNFKQKVKETNFEKYGVENPSQLEEFKNRIRSTNIERYGVPHPTMNSEVVEKRKQNNKEKYGVENILQKESPFREKIDSRIFEIYGCENVFQNEMIKEKIKKTNIEKFGVDNPSQAEEIKIKKQNTTLQNWGVKNPSQNKTVTAKARNTLYKNGSVPTSKQQKYLQSLLGGILNYPINYCNVDLLLDNNLIIEYNGGGHNLQVQLGHMTQEEFDEKEKRRTYFLRKKGYKIIKIISPYDYLPYDDVLIKEIEKAKLFFDEGHSIYIIDIGKSINNEKYGKLRKIKS